MGDSTFHSALSPSARHRWGACPGSVREEAKYPEPPDAPVAVDGTRTHALLERLVKYEFIDKEGVCGPAPLIFTTHTDEHGTFTVDADRAARLNVALEWIRENAAGRQVIAETRVFPDGLVLRADMSGTVDIQIVGKDVYVVADYKDGMSPVQAKDNPQLIQYATGVLAGLPVESYPKKWRMVIIQPRLAVKGMPVISTWEITTEELLAQVPVLAAQAAATDDPNAPLVPGEAQCKYCRAKGSCVARSGKVMEEVGLMFSPVPGQPAITPEVIPAGVLDPAQQAAARDPNAMGDQELRQLVEAAPSVRQLLKDAEEEALRRLQSGKAIPGLKLVQGRGTRQWALPEEEMVKKFVGMKIPKSAMYKTELISPAQAEKLVWDNKGEPQKLSDIQLKRMQQEYITTSAGKLTVALESDSRPAVVLDASPMFSAVAAPPAFLAPPSFLAPPPATASESTPALPAWMK